MAGGYSPLRFRLHSLLDQWRQDGLPTRWQLEQVFAEILAWREATHQPGLWDCPPVLATATLDDGWGHGLQIIETCARTIGMETVGIGLCQSPDLIVDQCRILKPQFLGLTILQEDLREQAAALAHRLPDGTRLLIGGPTFTHDPEWHLTFIPYQVCRNLADFLDVMLHTSGTD